MIKKLGRIYYNNMLYLNFVVFMFVIYILYLHKATVNVPYSDFWRLINTFADKTFQGDLSLIDLWASHAGHRAPIQSLVFILNMKYFYLNTQIEVYAGAVVMAMTCLFIYAMAKKSSICFEKKDVIFQFLSGVIALLVFNFNQWEITTVEFSFACMLRLFLYVVFFFSLDRLLIDTINIKKRIVSISLFLVVLALLFSAGYILAFFATISLIIIFNYFLKFKEQYKYTKFYLGIIGVMILSIIIYMYKLDMPYKSTNLFFTLWHGIFDGSLIKGIGTMLAACLVHIDMLPRLGTMWQQLIGIVCFLFSLYSLYLYAKFRIYNNTYMPLILIIYSYVSMLLVYSARIGLYDIQYLASSRYVTDTNLGLIGIALISIECITRKIRLGQEQLYSIRHILKHISMNGLIIAMISVAVVASGNYEIKKAPYERLFFSNLVCLMQNINTLSDSELAPFNTNPIEVRNAVARMQKYKLGIYHEVSLK